MAVQSSLYLLERAGHIQRVAAAGTPHKAETTNAPWSAGGRVAGAATAPTADTNRRRARGIVMLDSAPATELRVKADDVERRAGLERRKLREIIEFCYTDYCYRAHILDYFGDRHHPRQCGTCGNCSSHSDARTPLTSAELSSATGVRSPHKRVIKASSRPAVLRPLNDDELLCVRKILACASRMKGRFGKNILAATLRGSASKNVMKAHLNELSTYGLLKDMKQDDVLLYVDALCAALCLRISPGEYPTVSITQLGERVMREQQRIKLALAAESASKQDEERLLPATALQTHTLFSNGHPVEDIATERKLKTETVEGHLIECLSAGLTVDISRVVSESDQALIEKAIVQHGTDKFKLLRESLPENITYNMIRFVVARHLLQTRDTR